MKISITILNITLTLLFCLASCERKESFSITENKGISYIRNSAKPVYDSLNLELNLITSVNYQDICESAIYPHDLKISGNKLFIKDRKANKIRIFDLSGTYLKSFGGKGSGPGETNGLYWFFTKRDTIMVPEFLTGKLVKYNLEGEFLTNQQFGQFSAPIEYHPIADNNYLNGKIDVRLSVDKGVRQSMIYICSIVKRNDQNQILDTLYVKNYHINYKEPVDNSVGANMLINNGNIYLNEKSADKFVIKKYDKNFNLKQEISKNYRSIELSAKEKEKLRKLGEKRNITYGVKYKKSISDLLIDKYGNLWVDTYKKNPEDEKALQLFNIFSQKGIYLADYIFDDYLDFIDDKLVIYDPENYSVKIYDYNYENREYQE